MSIILVAAMSQNRVIGKDNQLPRHIPQDLQHFKNLTFGHTIIMGRKTYESIGRPLPQRHNIVLTRDPERDDPRVTVVNDIQLLMDTHTTMLDEDFYIIGGAEIYQYFLPLADQIELTQVHRVVDGDTFFPEFEENFVEVARNQQNGHDFVTYRRKESR